MLSGSRYGFGREVVSITVKRKSSGREMIFEVSHFFESKPKPPANPLM